MMRRRA